MILNTDKHEVDKIREYQNMGYLASYRLKAGKLQDLETKKRPMLLNFLFLMKFCHKQLMF